jgi:hypothetical protein
VAPTGYSCCNATEVCCGDGFCHFGAQCCTESVPGFPSYYGAPADAICCGYEGFYCPAGTTCGAPDLNPNQCI